MTSPISGNMVRKVDKLSLEKFRNTPKDFPKMAKIPALSALFEFPANPPVCPVDVVNMTHARTVEVGTGGKYSFKPQTELNAFLKKGPPPGGNMVQQWAN